jgi:hypothetical protein
MLTYLVNPGFNESRQDISSVTISEPSIELVPDELNPVPLAEVRDLPRPHEVLLKSVGAGLLNVSASAAPSNWLFVFNTTYDPLWKVEGGTGILEAKHVRVNLFMNGWIITGRSLGDQQFRLVYGEQQAWIRDVVSSLICLFLAVGVYIAQLYRLRMP